jgi:hypothetical protein
MPTNLHSLAQHIRTTFIERVNADLAHLSSNVRLRVGTPATVKEVGIHLHSPSEVEVLDAMERADREGFPHIYVYAQEA